MREEERKKGRKGLKTVGNSYIRNGEDGERDKPVYDILFLDFCLYDF